MSGGWNWKECRETLSVMEQVRNIISGVKRVLWVASFKRGGDGESVRDRIADEVRSGAEQSGKNTWEPNTFMGRG